MWAIDFHFNQVMDRRSLKFFDMMDACGRLGGTIWWAAPVRPSAPKSQRFRAEVSRLQDHLQRQSELRDWSEVVAEGGPFRFGLLDGSGHGTDGNVHSTQAP